jgi:hypothetical protein
LPKHTKALVLCLITITGIGHRIPSAVPLSTPDQAHIDLQQNKLQEEDNAMMREINPLTLFIKIIPSTYDIKKDCGLVVQRQALFAIVTVVPAPGVDVWRCYESVCRECPCTIVRDERKSPILKHTLHLRT